MLINREISILLIIIQYVDRLEVIHREYLTYLIVISIP